MYALIRLLLKEQSDLGLHCLHRPFCQIPWETYGADKNHFFTSGVVVISNGQNSGILLNTNYAQSIQVLALYE